MIESSIGILLAKLILKTHHKLFQAFFKLIRGKITRRRTTPPVMHISKLDQ